MGKIAIPLICRAHGFPEPVAEYRFAPPRRWRFDFCWPNHRLALEVQGGLWTRGRHTRGAALLKEHEKLNTAAAMGYRVLFCTPDDVRTGRVAGPLAAAFREGQEAR